MSTHPVENPRAESRTPVSAEKRAGLTFRRHFTQSGRHPFDEIAWELRSRGHQRRGRQGRSSSRRTSRCPQVLVACWPPTWWRRSTSAARRARRSARLACAQLVGARGGHDHALGRAGRLLRHRPRTAGLPRRADAPAAPAEGGLQLAGLVQRGRRGAPAVLGLLHQLRRRHMESILALAKTEGMLFKYGSGTGSNLSPLRSARELLAGGGTASGPVSFMKGFDAFAGRHQVRRQDAPRGEDGHPQRRPPGHPRLHPLQGRARRRRPGR